MRTQVFTDGSCSGNPGPGGWAWIIPNGNFAAGYSPDTTNQRMELLAVIEAVTTVQGPLEIISDSTYVVNCFRDSWWKGWLKRNWKIKLMPLKMLNLFQPNFANGLESCLVLCLGWAFYGQNFKRMT